MAVKIRNALAPSQERHRLEHAVREALESGRAEFEAVITHAVDPNHAELLILQSGRRCAAYFVDLHGPVEELSRQIRQGLHHGQEH
jgi:hypothetical protein